MRYMLLIPEFTIDPRHLDTKSQDEFLLCFKSSSKLDHEVDAVESVRGMWPDAIVLPVPIRIGSGSAVVLGILPNIYKHDLHRGKSDIPFVAVVQAISEASGEARAAARKNGADGPWTRKLWRVPVDDRGVSIDDVDVELRSSGHDTPLPMKMRVTFHEGRAIFAGRTPGEVDMSFSFDLSDLNDLSAAASKGS